MPIYDSLIDGVKDDDGVVRRLSDGLQSVFDEQRKLLLDISLLNKIDGTDDNVIQFLLSSVGWDGYGTQSFVQSLNIKQQRRLLRLTAKIWKSKGSVQFFMDVIWTLLGKRLFIRDFFYNRVIESDLLLSSDGATEPVINGSVISYNDSTLVDMMIDRSGLTYEDHKLIFNFLHSVKPVSTQMFVVYCSFFDNFHKNDKHWEDIGSVESYWDSNTMVLPVGSSISPDTRKEPQTWTDGIFIGTHVVMDDNSSNGITIEVSEAEKLYLVTLTADGDWSLLIDDGTAEVIDSGNIGFSVDTLQNSTIGMTFSIASGIDKKILTLSIAGVEVVQRDANVTYDIDLTNSHLSVSRVGLDNVNVAMMDFVIHAKPFENQAIFNNEPFICQKYDGDVQA